MLAQFSMFPVGSDESLAEDVAKILDIIDNSGLSYKFTPMATVVEGEWDEVMALIKKCRDAMRQSNNRVHISIAIDDRKGVHNQLSAKVESVETILKRKLQK